MTFASDSFTPSVLPWSASDKENKRFNKITLFALVLTIMLSLVVKWQELPEQTREQKEKLPPQLTRIIEAQKVVPPKPIEPPKPKPIEKPVVENEPKPVEKPKKPKVEKKVTPKPVTNPKPTEAEVAQQAREKAINSGLLAHQDALAAMRNQSSISHTADTDMIKGAGKENNTQRQFIGKQVNTSSGGVKTAQLTTDTGSKGQLAGRKTTEYQAPNEGLASLAAKQLVEDSTVVGDRELESIRKVLDANKGAIYAIYRRFLRQDPSLQGKVTVNLEIAPNGSVSAIKLVLSELQLPALESKLLSRIKMVNFGDEQVNTTILDYSFNFLPF